MTWILSLATVTVVVTAVLYNRLVRDRDRVDAAWSDIDVQLQRRHDLVPQLVDVVDQYTKHERSTVEAIASLRADAMRERGIAARGRLEHDLAGGVDRLLALAEQYPDLKADRNFLQLQNQLVETENYLQFARRFYNGSVRALNTRIETVPSNVVARAFGFGTREHFQKSSDHVDEFPDIDLSTST